MGAQTSIFTHIKLQPLPISKSTIQQYPYETRYNIARVQTSKSLVEENQENMVKQN